MTKALRCVMAEDEPEARRNLADYLSEVPHFTLLGAAATGPEAVALVEREKPDLLLLDVRLPEMDGLAVLQALRHRPEVVFTTAHDSFAIAAFELGALDYLVKPFGRSRLVAAVERVRSRLATAGSAGGGATAVERAIAAEQRPLSRLFARKGDRIVPVAVRDVVHIAASGEYSEVRTDSDSFLIQVPLRELAECLDPARFERVGRSHIVSLDAVDHFRPADDRRLVVVLRDGTEIVASRSASERVRSRVR